MLSFKEFKFSHGDEFEPSKSTRNFWLYTKKSSSDFGSVILPGMFSTMGYSAQMPFFALIFVLEGCATYYGYNEGMFWIGVVGLIIFDIFLAICSHLLHDDICNQQNILATTEDNAERKRIKKIIKKYKWLKIIAYFLILLLSFVKCGFFYIAYLSIDAVFVTISLCYFIAALLHIQYTGYFLYTSRYNYKIGREYSDYIDSGKKAHAIDLNKPLDQPVKNQNVVLNPCNRGRHSLYKITTNGIDAYFLKTFGIMEDSELNVLIGAQQSLAAKQIVATEGVKQQLLMLAQGG